MQRKTIHCLAWVLFAASWAGGADLPDWAAPLARRPLDSYPPEIHAVCLLDDADFVVEPDGQTTLSHRIAFRVLSPAAVALGTRTFAVSSRTKLIDLEAAIEYPNGEVRVLRNKDAVETQLSDIFYSDVKSRIITLPDVVKGAFICFEYRIRDRDEFPSLAWWFQSIYPCLQSQLRVRTPGAGKLSWKEYPANRPQPQNDAGCLLFTRSNIPALPLEKLTPPNGQHTDRLELRVQVPAPEPPVVNLESWDGMARWYRERTAELWTGGGEVTRQATEICQGAATPEERLRRLCRWVQGQLRYVAIAIRDGGFVPHPPDDVCRNRYGDCKDKSFLLMAMLRSQGIRSWPVLCRTSETGEIDPDWFYPYSFNHCILALETSPGELRFFDPTSTAVGYPYLPENLEDTWGLLVQEDGGRLVRLHSGIEPLLSVDVQARLDPGGRLTAQVRESYRPNTSSSLRVLFQKLNEEERRSAWQRLLVGHQPGTRLKAFQVENLFEPELDLIFRYELEVADAMKSVGAMKLLRPFVVPDLEFPALPDKPRHAPLDLRALAIGIRYHLQMELPARFALEEGLEPLDLQTDFSRFALRMEMRDGKLLLDKELSFKNLRLGADRCDEVRKFLARLRNVQDTEIVLMER